MYVNNKYRSVFLFTIYLLLFSIELCLPNKKDFHILSFVFIFKHWRAKLVIYDYNVLHKETTPKHQWYTVREVLITCMGMGWSRVG